MSPNNKQKNNWARIRIESKYKLSVFGFSPNFDWKFLLNTFWLVLIILSVFSFYTYTNIMKAEDSGANYYSTGKKINTEKINKTIERFDLRKQSFFDLTSK